MIKGLICIGVLALAAVAGLSACSSAAPGTVKVETTESRVISVSASEEVRVEPDMAEVVYGVDTRAADAESCQSQNAEGVSSVVEALKALGVEEKSIQTSRFSLNPEYDWSGSEKRLTGYSMNTTITVADLPLDLVGTLLTKSVESGVNNIESVTYKSSRYDEAYAEALALAIGSAKTKAEGMAAAGGCTLGPVSDIEEVRSNQQSRYVNYNMAADMASSSAMESGVQPGELRITAQVNVTYAIQ